MSRMSELYSDRMALEAFTNEPEHLQYITTQNMLELLDEAEANPDHLAPETRADLEAIKARLESLLQ